MGDAGAEPLGSLLARSRSSDWLDRAEFADDLGRCSTEPEAFGRLAEMLDDVDESVIEAAARAMLLWSGTDGAELVFMRLAAGEAEPCAEFDVEASQEIQDKITRMGADGLPTREIAEHVANSRHLAPGVRASARMEGVLGVRDTKGHPQHADDRVALIEATKRATDAGEQPGATIDVWTIES